MKALLAQLNPTVGDVAGNLQKVFSSLESARAAGATLVVFPELTLTGYPPRDILDYTQITQLNQAGFAQIAPRTAGLAAVVGCVLPNAEASGHPFFNAAAVFIDGKHHATYYKQLLPYYDVFDDTRYFEPGSGPLVFTFQGKKIGLTICEDIWNVPGFLPRPYRVRPLDAYAAAKVDLLVNLSASPFSLGKPAERKRLVAKVAQIVGCPVLLCNQVGGQDELLFDGGSLAVTRDGELLTEGPAFEEKDVFCEPFAPASAASPPVPPREEAAWLALALETGLRDYVHKCGASRVVLGLSGGIDSSVTACVAARALGRDAVLGVALPTRFNASTSAEDAEKTARHLGIAFDTIAIEPVLGAFEKLTRGIFHQAPTTLTLENLQPRVRMTLLMALANETHRLLLNTSNKSEIATGYSTLYGDSAGALAVLGDLTKGQVYALARFYNQPQEIIPVRVLERAPSAELRFNQTDQDSLPPYGVLDRMVEDCVEAGRGLKELFIKGYPPEQAQQFARLHALSEYKRRQMPPILRVSRRAFGMGWRAPIASAKPYLV